MLSSTGSYLGRIGDDGAILGGGWLEDGPIVGVTADEVRYYDSDTQALTGTVALDAGPKQSLFNRVALDIDGDGVVVGTDGGEVVLVQGGDRRQLAGGADPVAVVSYAADQGLVAVGDTAGVVHLVNSATGRERWATDVMVEDSFAEVVGPERWAALGDLQDVLVSVEGYAFRTGPLFVEVLDGGDVLVGAGPYLRRLDSTSGAIEAEFLLDYARIPGQPATPRVAKGVTVAPDGRFEVLAGGVALADVDPTLSTAIWADIPTGRAAGVQTTSIVLDSSGVPWVGLDNGQLTRGTTEVAATGEPIPIGLATIRSVAVAPEGGAVLAAGDGGMVLWSTDGHQLLASAAPLGGNDESFISADGRQLITMSNQAGLDAALLRGPR